MANETKKILLIIAAILSIAAIVTAFPSMPTYDPGGMPNIPQVIGPSNPNNFSSILEHPAQGPQAEIPAFEPSANMGSVSVTSGEKQVLASQDIMAFFGSEPQSLPSPSPPKPSGIKIWALYNGMWTIGPSGVSQFQQMNLLVKNNQWQKLWGYDSNSFPQWTFWGYMEPGFIPSTFYADTKEWHMCAIWGSVYGFSNALPIFVW